MGGGRGAGAGGFSECYDKGGNCVFLIALMVEHSRAIGICRCMTDSTLLIVTNYSPYLAITFPSPTLQKKKESLLILKPRVM